MSSHCKNNFVQRRRHFFQWVSSVCRVPPMFWAVHRICFELSAITSISTDVGAQTLAQLLYCNTYNNVRIPKQR